MIKLTCLLSLLDFILGIRETKFRDVVKSTKIYNESQHYMWHWYPETIIPITEFMTQGHAININNGELKLTLIS